MYNGIINVYKEAGFTSHDVVAKLRGILKQKKIGHTGTLDPDAVGVLPVCLGSATKLCDMLTDKSKEYRTEFLLGKVTDTQDISGKVLSEEAVDATALQVQEAALSFVGAYEQVPPMYSAIKVDGKKLYQLAREGREIERKARPVHIDYITINSIELPKAAMTVGCSKGTYIRTLCHDIGQKLGCGAVMTHLERTRAGGFVLADSMTLGDIEKAAAQGAVGNYILPVDAVFKDYKAVTVEEKFKKLIDNGNSFYAGMLTEEGAYGDEEPVRVYGCEGKFYGIYEYCSRDERFAPVKMFLEK